MAVAGLLCLMLLPASHGAPGGATNARPGHAVTVGLDWGTTVARAATAATIEVDVMPFLGRAARGGPFNAYYEALASLGAAFVRFAPWYPNPRVTVPELRPSDCDARTPATNWNSTLLDGVVRDFMAAVCGPNAAAGACARSVVPQLSTMPSWMYVGGTDPATLPEDPWDTPDPFSAYEAGTELVDKTCRQMARYFGRVVGWYTAGGFADECGHFHASPYRYAWYGLSVLNEDEHKLRPGGGVAYTTCFDAIAEEVAKVNPRVVLVGPELINGHPLTYMTHFLNGSNHRHGRAPRIASYHFGTAATGATAATFFADWDAFVAGTVDAIGAAVRRLGAGTELVLNEYIPFVNDWCDCTGVEHLCGGVAFPARCPNWQHNRTAGGDPDLRHAKGVGINRRTVGWNAAAACFAYGFGTLAERGYKYVAQDQLVGGPWPDNEPAVSCMDWQTGQVNAKYWVTQLLAATVGTTDLKRIARATVRHTDALYVLPYKLPGGARGLLVVNKTPRPLAVQFEGLGGGAASCVEVGVGVAEPGFAPPLAKALPGGVLQVGGYGVCVVTQLEDAPQEGP